MVQPRRSQSRDAHLATGWVFAISSSSVLFLFDQEGMNFLRRAQVMYTWRPQAVRDACEARCENNYTMTMSLGIRPSMRSRYSEDSSGCIAGLPRFYLAQAYGALQKPVLSARFCAETMSRQLEAVMFTCYKSGDSQCLSISTTRRWICQYFVWKTMRNQP